MSKIEYVVKPFFIKSLTGQGELAKQYFTLMRAEGYPLTLSISARVLTKDHDLYSKRYKLIKLFKGYGLYENRFSIKMSSLAQALSTISRKA